MTYKIGLDGEINFDERPNSGVLSIRARCRLESPNVSHCSRRSLVEADSQMINDSDAMSSPVCRDYDGENHLALDFWIEVAIGHRWLWAENARRYGEAILSSFGHRSCEDSGKEMRVYDRESCLGFDLLFAFGRLLREHFSKAQAFILLGPHH